jgi:hypothetical protein
MSDQHLGDAWRERERSVSISAVPHFTPEGLVLGAGTILVPADGLRRLQSLEGQQARVLALLAVAYGKAIAPTVLGNIARAARAWNEGDECLAYVHLAHARLPALERPSETARRLFLADSFIKAGLQTRYIFDALHATASYIDAIEKAYNPAEPRVPAGNSKASGEWTVAPSYLATLPAAQRQLLARFAIRLLPRAVGPAVVAAAGAIAVFGLLFVPTNKDIRVEGPVPGMPGLRYSWNGYDGVLHLIYERVDGGHRTVTAHQDDDLFRDERGRIVGVVLPNGILAVEPGAIFPELTNDDEPKLCPDRSRDKRTNDKGLEYENYIKTLVNPGNPTPSGMGYFLPRLSSGGKGVTFDDCEHHTGTMVEIKDGYTGFLRTESGKQLLERLFVEQALSQVEAANGRPVRWYFSQKQTMDFAREIFRSDPRLKDIDVRFEPLPGSGE